MASPDENVPEEGALDDWDTVVPFGANINLECQMAVAELRHDLGLNNTELMRMLISLGKYVNDLRKANMQAFVRDLATGQEFLIGTPGGN
jgi:hypothetical protein